jgi:hypothetical protein
VVLTAVSMKVSCLGYDAVYAVTNVSEKPKLTSVLSRFEGLTSSPRPSMRLNHYIINSIYREEMLNSPVSIYIDFPTYTLGTEFFL